MSNGSARINKLHRIYENANRDLREFMEAYEDVMEQLADLTEKYNTALDRFQRACREKQIGAGPITVTTRDQRLFDPEYLADLLKDRPKDLANLIEVTHKVKPAVFDKLASQGVFTKKQIEKSILDVKTITSLNGVPVKINIT